jgi:nitroreductase
VTFLNIENTIAEPGEILDFTNITCIRGRKKMNKVFEAIKNRRSIRSYKPDSIPKDIINSIIEAGNQAPSRGRLEEGSIQFQPWRFVVVKDPEFRLKLVQTTVPFWKKMIEGMKESQPEMYEDTMTNYEALDEPKDVIYYAAPVIIFVIGPTDYAVSCALACENIMIAATSLGLGSCYVGFGSMVTSNTNVMEALEIKEGERIYGPIVLGYPENESSTMVGIQQKRKEPKIKWI